LGLHLDALIANSPLVTEVFARRGRRWVYGALDPARPVEFKFVDLGKPSIEFVGCVDAMIALAAGVPIARTEGNTITTVPCVVVRDGAQARVYHHAMQK
jgi:hypothetical protein